MWKFTGRHRPSFATVPADGQESVWDYPRPPILQPDCREVAVFFGELQIARTKSAIRVLETASPPTVYIPREDVHLELLTQSIGNSYCEWKGQATYWSIETAGKTIKNVGWSYERPTDRFQPICGFLSFYPALVDCRIDGEKVRPQPGGFYGGWVTNEIVGPYKGEPGTNGW